MTDTQPTLHTPRLLLRPLTLRDASDVRKLAGERDVAAMTTYIPHPYPAGVAKKWIRNQYGGFAAGKAITFAVTLQQKSMFLGVVELKVDMAHQRAGLGYWLGKPYWNCGYCTEAAGAVISYAFKSLGLNRVSADHFGCNPASGRVLEKIGMQVEGCRRQHMKKLGVFEDLIEYGMTKDNLAGQKKSG